MPLSREHKKNTRTRILEAARRLFNKRGFNNVPIDDIMAEAGLTRGGFYNHFRAKEDLYAEALTTFADGAKRAVISSAHTGPDRVLSFIRGYISRRHLQTVEDQCPLIALSTDVARAGPATRQAYEGIVRNIIEFFENEAPSNDTLTARERSLATAAICIGAMVLARTVDDKSLAEEICDASRKLAEETVIPSKA
ncbi:TetR/AcrR family transcriptional regulator [Hwanghaeella grinnelliae]|uniref:TetR/AcrR family transcriptional regulator n=1 Tax=Hwanghaeella grinnelliae TaxID=2500179 RepID=A0A437QY68_9PROT|nr:TetR/AcrR family transcriptional regulator [Hwanghaeella grinnelliae]RVU39468.1 TetR/AcrR family transcriptional regulator [Hwanghaeella grinnelliae]